MMMKLELPKAWFERKAGEEGDLETGAGTSRRSQGSLRGRETLRVELKGAEAGAWNRVIQQFRQLLEETIKDFKAAGAAVRMETRGSDAVETAKEQLLKSFGENFSSYDSAKADLMLKLEEMRLVQARSEQVLLENEKTRLLIQEQRLRTFIKYLAILRAHSFSGSGGIITIDLRGAESIPQEGPAQSE